MHGIYGVKISNSFIHEETDKKIIENLMLEIIDMEVKYYIILFFLTLNSHLLHNIISKTTQ